MDQVMKLLHPFGVVVLATAITGCATPQQQLYHWDGYQRQIYEYMKGDGVAPGEQLKALEVVAEKARAGNRALPPGFRAHVGLVKLQLGQELEARNHFEAEKAAFPESAPYMDFLLKSMQEKKS
jgi:hypothetical protein